MLLYRSRNKQFFLAALQGNNASFRIFRILCAIAHIFGKTERTEVCPAKAGRFSRSQSCQGKSQNPVAWIARWRETKILEPIDKTIKRMGASYQAVTKVNAEVAPKGRSPGSRACFRKAKAR